MVTNNFRSVNVNKTEGTVSVNETYIAMTSSGLGYEDVQVNTSQSLEEPWVTVTVDGTVNGLTSLWSTAGCPAYGSTILGAPKFNGAVHHVVGSRSCFGEPVFTRAQNVSSMQRPFYAGTSEFYFVKSQDSLSQTLGYNPIAGTVTYSYTYNNRPVQLLCTGAHGKHNLQRVGTKRCLCVPHCFRKNIRTPVPKHRNGRSAYKGTFNRSDPAGGNRLR